MDIKIFSQGAYLKNLNVSLSNVFIDIIPILEGKPLKFYKNYQFFNIYEENDLVF